ncbi:MAG: hypothetical protein L5655_10765 [Thermosediminibacteraceae bacterium]|nr:hypothetical protein [Thermosediminibacteraceae bacterium]
MEICVLIVRNVRIVRTLALGKKAKERQKEGKREKSEREKGEEITPSGEG